MKKSDFEFLIELLHRNAGWKFSEREYFSIDKKISNFIREKGFASVEDLIAELKVGQKALISQVIESLAFSDTRFYRDYNVFNQFENYVLPLVKEANRSFRKLRILSLGCSTGQEVYSIAMAVKERLIGINDWNLSIIGTDLSSSAIARAQKGFYNNFEIQTGLNARRIIDNFTFDGTGWQIKDDIRKMITFRRFNLLDEVVFNDKFDIIFCRNVLRFFTPNIQKALVEKIHKLQVHGGILYLGRGEQVNGIDVFYGSIPGVSCSYQAKYIQTTKETPTETVRLVSRSIELDTPKEEMPSFVRPDVLGLKKTFLNKI